MGKAKGMETRTTHASTEKTAIWGKDKKEKGKTNPRKKNIKATTTRNMHHNLWKSNIFLKVKVDIEINYTSQKISLTDDLQSCNVPLDGKSGQ